MNASFDKTTSFTYPIYIQATPEQVWQGLTDPVLMKTLLAPPKGW